MSKVVWKLSKEDNDDIQNLYEKKVALENLSKIIDPDNEKLYNRLLSDYRRTCTEFQRWWDVTSQKYQWEGGNWRIDFDNSEVIEA